MNYRKANLNDLDSLAILFDQYRVFYKKQADLPAARAFLKERLTKGDSNVYVAESDNELLGFVQLYPLFSSTRMKKLWLLNDLFVSAKHRGKGISKKLIAKAKNLVKESGACGMYLETGHTNHIGNQLYPKTGFKLNENSNFYEWDV